MGENFDDPEGTYGKAVRRYGADAVHDALAQRGPDVLAQGVPYLLWAAHRARLDRRRKEGRRGRLAPTSSAESIDTVPDAGVPDPYEQLVANEAWRRVVEALAEMRAEDSLALWWHFEGHDDGEIVERLTKAGFSIRPASLRKRRERALGALRRRLGTDA